MEKIGSKMSLLPEDAIKSVTLSLDLNREIPRVITIGLANEEFFKTMEEITFKLDESEKLENWSRDSSDYFKAFGNILLNIN
jgi:hypothetical protein